MNSWQCMCEVAIRMGHKVEYQIYQRPSNNTTVFYIMYIDGVKYLKKWPDQEEARKRIKEILLGGVENECITNN